MSPKNLIYGLHPFIEAVKSGKEIEKVLIQRGLKKETFSEVYQLLKEHSIPYQFVPQEKLTRITTRNHQGIITFLSAVEYQNFEEIVQRIFEKGDNPLLMILDQITDVRNFGAVARSSECFGVDALLIPAKGSASINEDAMKTSAGALNRIPVCRVTRLTDAIIYLKNSGIKIIAVSEKGDNSISDYDFTEPLALIVGSEEKGISPGLLELTDGQVKIPMKGLIESLNVSVAAGICLYEVLRQRMGQKA